MIGLAICGLACVGLIAYEEETGGLLLWTPEGSEYRTNTEFVQSEFPSNSRGQFILHHCEGSGCNVLTGEGVREMYGLRKKIMEIVAGK